MLESARALIGTKIPNEYLVDGDVTLIKLKEGVWTKIDTKNYDKVRYCRWGLSNGYARTATFGPTINMSRFLVRGKEDEVPDHINRDRLDNREENLRWCSFSENSLNADRCDKTVEQRAFNTLREGFDLEEMTKDLPPKMRDLLLWSQTENFKRFIEFLSSLYEGEKVPTTLSELRILQDWPDLMAKWLLKEKD